MVIPLANRPPCRLMHARFRILVQDLPYKIEHLAKVTPGVKFIRRPQGVDAPADAAYLITSQLDALGIPYGLDVTDEYGQPVQLIQPAAYDRAFLVRAIQTSGLISGWLVEEGTGPWTLHDFQLRAIWWALEMGGGFLKEAPGAGKTVQAAVWLGLQREGLRLVVTKSPVVEQLTGWFRQFCRGPVLALDAPSRGPTRKIEGPRVFNDIKGVWEVERETVPVRERLEAYFAQTRAAKTQPILVVGWDSLRIHLQDLLEAPDTAHLPWRAVVFDESHYARGTKRFDAGKDIDGNFVAVGLENRTHAAWRLAAEIPERLTMTATPMPDRRINLWGQLSLLRPGRNVSHYEPGGYGLFSGPFARRYCGGKPGRHGGFVARGETHTDELQHRLSVVMHVVNKNTSHAHLPPVTVETIFVPTSAQDPPSPGFKRDMKRLAKLARRGDQSARGKLFELQLQEAATRKRKATLAQLEDYLKGTDGGLDIGTDKDVGCGKALVFTGRHRDCHELGERAKRQYKHADIRSGIDKHVEVVGKRKDGRDKTRTTYSLPEYYRREALRDWYMTHPGPCGLFATGQAWGTGLDLHDTDLLVINMLPFSPGDFDQWMGRVNRLGQKRKVLILIMIAVGTIEEAVLAILAEKVPDIARVVQEEALAGLRDTLLGYDDLEATMREVSEANKAAFAAMQADEADWEAIDDY